MAREFRMPSLGADMEAGTLVEWLKKPGDTVGRGDIVAVVETQKGAIEIEIFEDGVIDRLIVQPGATVPVDTVLATLRGEGEPPATPAAAQPEPPPPPRPAPAPPRPAAPRPLPPPAAPREGRAITPGARRLAAELGIDVARVSGSGPGGVVLRADVERAAAGEPAAEAAVAAPPRPTPPEAERQAAMRQAIAAAMAHSKREIPHYYLATTIDMGRALGWLEAENQRLPVAERLLPAVLLLKAVALALRRAPELNGSFKDGTFQPSAAVHVGWAVALRGGGLIAPGIHDADRKDLRELMAALRDLVRRARSGGLRSSQLADPTVTVTSLGDQGVESVQGVIFPPQVAIVGFGTVVTRPWVVDGAVAARPTVTATLSADHRVSDGHRGALFLAAVERLLQEPDKL